MIMMREDPCYAIFDGSACEGCSDRPHDPPDDPSAFGPEVQSPGPGNLSRPPSPEEEPGEQGGESRGLGNAFLLNAPFGVCDPSLPPDFAVEPDLAWEIGAHYTLVNRRLFFSVHPDDAYTLSMIQNSRRLFFFSNDLPERYSSFCADWGPTSINLVLRFVRELREKWQHPRLQNRPLIYYCSDDPYVFTNTALMLAAYLMIDHGMSADEAIFPFARIGSAPFRGYRDATWCKQTFFLHAVSVLRGLERAIELGWLGELPADDFDVEEYEYYDDPSAFNLNQITPKFVAFIGPQDHDEQKEWTPFQHEPSEFVDEFLQRGVTTVVRLNEPSSYDPTPFTAAGIHVVDLEFPDCSVPSCDVVERFLDCIDEAEGRIAVHCLAGLGRTGTLIAVHMMKHHGFAARDAIGYLRLMRPGSVIGPQQDFLEAVELRGSWNGNRLSLAGGEWVYQDAEKSAQMARDVEAAVRGGCADRVPSGGSGGGSSGTLHVEQSSVGAHTGSGAGGGEGEGAGRGRRSFGGGKGAPEGGHGAGQRGLGPQQHG